MNYEELEKLNISIRRDVIKMLGASKSGHPGGSLSCVEIISTLYFKMMKLDPTNPKWEDRDRFVLSKGHAAPTLYAVLAERGYFPVEELLTLRKFGSRLQGHPDMKRLPGIDMSTGSLAQGMSVAVGIALGEKTKKSAVKVYVVVGDGELDEGQTWEASMAAAHYKLNNLTVIVDYNKCQIDGRNCEVMDLGDLKKKFEAFGFYVISGVNGHSPKELYDAYNVEVSEKPKCIIANTIKGKGVSFMEDKVGWHGKAPNSEEVLKALSELGGIK